jgi:hypothetical protein
MLSALKDVLKTVVFVAVLAIATALIVKNEKMKTKIYIKNIDAPKVIFDKAVREACSSNLESLNITKDTCVVYADEETLVKVNELKKSFFVQNKTILITK